MSALPIHNPHLIAARVVADSISEAGVRLTTMEWDIPRCILAQVNTYGILSRVSASNRAIPTRKVLSTVNGNPYITPTWRYVQKGMEPAGAASPEHVQEANEIVLGMLQAVSEGVRRLNEINLSKEDVNRYLEPWQYTTIVISGTEWDNLFAQRIAPDAQGAFNIIAAAAREALADSTPVWRPTWVPMIGPRKYPDHLSWHLPYITDEEREKLPPIYLPRMSAVRISRVSYAHQGEPRTVEEEIARFHELRMNKHLSPSEQTALAMDTATQFYGRIRGWKPLRKMFAGESGSKTHGTQVSDFTWGII